MTTERFKTVAASAHFQHGITTDSWADALAYARTHQGTYCVVVEDCDSKQVLYLRHCTDCTCCNPAPEVCAELGLYMVTYEMDALDKVRINWSR